MYPVGSKLDPHSVNRWRSNLPRAKTKAKVRRTKGRDQLLAINNNQNE